MINLIEQMRKTHGLIQAKQNNVSALSVSAPSQSEMSYADQETLDQLYGNLETVYRCVKFIAENVARVPLKVFRGIDKNKMDVTDHPDFLILKKPNPFQTRNEFWQESINRLEMQGELFWSMQLDARGRPVQMYADWQSKDVTIVPDPERLVKKYVLTRNGKTFEFDPEEIFFVKFFNPYSTLRGLSPLFAARHSATLDLNAIAFNKNFFKQGMKFSGILSTEQNLNVDDAERMKEKFEEIYNGVNQMHRVAVLWNGVKFDPLQSMSMNDAQFVQMREMNELKIMSVYGIYPEVLGIGKATYENVKYYRRMVWTEMLQPLIEKFISLINEFLLPRLTNMSDVYVEPDYSGIEALKEDRSQKVKDFSEAVDRGVVSRNEMRSAVYGFEPITGDPLMEKPIPKELLAAMAGGERPKELKELDIKKKNGFYENVRTYEQRTVVWLKEIRRAEKHEAKFKRFIVKFFKEQKKRVLARIDKYLQGHKSILTSDNVLFDYEAERKRLMEQATPEILAVFSDAAGEIMDSLDAGAFDMESPSVRMALGQRVSRFSTFVSTETDKRITSVITDVLQENAGQNIDELAREIYKRVNVLFDEFTEARARLIARTEVMGAFNMGTQEGLVQAAGRGLVQNKMWITSRDDRVRDTHQIDGQVVGINESFVLQDGSEMLYPHDFNERCVMIATKEPKTFGESVQKPQYLDLGANSDMREANNLLAHNYYQEVLKDAKQIDALYGYKGADYININTYLRFGEEGLRLYNPLPDAQFNELKKYIEKQISLMQKAIESNTLEKDIILYRNANGFAEYMFGGFSEEELNAMIGNYIFDNGFVSTTLNPDYAAKFDTGVGKFLMKIRVKKGTPGIALDKGVSFANSESEILLQSGNKFKVLDIYKNPKFDPSAANEMPEWIIEMELVN